MVGDPRRPETRQGGSGRPRGGCSRGRRGGRDRIDPVLKMGTDCWVCLCILQWFYRSWMRIHRWQTKRQEYSVSITECPLQYPMRLRSSQTHKTKLNVSYSLTRPFIMTIPLNETIKFNKKYSSSILRCHFLIAISFLADEFFVDTPNIKEGCTIRQDPSSSFSERDRCGLDPRVDPSNTLLVASQTRHDGSRADLGRRACRAWF